MRRLLPIAMALAALFAACGEPEGFRKPEDALDAGREFIRAVLDADYGKAELYILKDEEGTRLFERYKSYMKNRPEPERLGLKSASILIHSVAAVDDSTTVIEYSNSYSRKHTPMRVVKRSGEWWIDFSHTVSGEATGMPQGDSTKLPQP